MAFDALEALRQAGSPVDLLSDAERDVLALLTEAEKNTRDMLDGMLRSLGFQRVAVTFGTAAPPARR